MNLKESTLLAIDALIDFALGLLLIVFPRGVLSFLGVPRPDSAFYPSILGGVLVGIGIALWLERDGDRRRTRGLGLHGAIAVNLCGALVLTGWLLLGNLRLPPRGAALLWGIAVLVLGVGIVEIVQVRRARGGP